MDNRKLCGVCGKERVYNDYHIISNSCEICVAKNSARYYQANRDETIAKSKLHRENTKNMRKSHSQRIKHLDNKVEELTRAMEILIVKN